MWVHQCCVVLVYPTSCSTLCTVRQPRYVPRLLPPAWGSPQGGSPIAQSRYSQQSQKYYSPKCVLQCSCISLGCTRGPLALMVEVELLAQYWIRQSHCQ